MDHRLRWYSEGRTAPSHRSGSVGDGCAQREGREWLDHPGIRAGTTGEEDVGLAVEKHHNRNGFVQIADRAGDRHAAHRCDLKVDDRNVRKVGLDGSSGGRWIRMVDELVSADAESGMHAADDPFIIGNDQYA